MPRAGLRSPHKPIPCKHTCQDFQPWIPGPLMTSAAISAGAAAAPGTCGAHATAGSALVTAALESENGHHPLYVGGTASVATDRFIAAKHKLLESHLTTVTFKLINGHWIFTSTHKIRYSLTTSKNNYSSSPGQPDRVTPENGMVYCATPSHPSSMRTGSPSCTFLSRAASPSTRPTGLTALAGRISPPRLMGVGPKKIQNALPVGQ